MSDRTITPHAGYHWNNKDSRFFEGWYFRVTLPQEKQSFAFIYSIEDPLGGQSISGGAVQILGIDEQYLCRSFPDVNQFWASKSRLELGHWRKTALKIRPQLLQSAIFTRDILEGYQATSTLHQGYIRDPGTDQDCRWYYEIKPIYGWGKPNLPQKATAGWLSYLPIADPGWQVLTAYGLASGWIEWNNQRYEFLDTPFYAEKNWGHSFPEKWFWINCNRFSDESDLTLTAVGTKRKVLWWSELVGLIGIHYKGQFYSFSSLDSQLTWRVQPWGKWEMQAQNEYFTVKLLGTTQETGTWLRVPTAEGLQFGCRDTTKGHLILELRDNTGKIIIDGKSDLCGLEIGGNPWNEEWRKEFL
jgi:tocopherol cyclase